MLTLYQFSSNTPIMATDLAGLEADESVEYDESNSESILELIASGDIQQAANQMVDGLTSPKYEGDFLNSIGSLFIVKQEALAAEEHMINTADDLLVKTQETMDNVSTGAAIVTIGSGGLSSPVSGPVTVAAQGTSLVAGVLRIPLAYAKGDNDNSALLDLGLTLLTRSASNKEKSLAPKELFSHQGKDVMDTTIDLNVETADIFISEIESNNNNNNDAEPSPK
jgi:hypothetical protein